MSDIYSFGEVTPAIPLAIPTTSMKTALRQGTASGVAQARPMTSKQAAGFGDPQQQQPYDPLKFGQTVSSISRYIKVLRSSVRSGNL
jgi:hypothetical protein